LIDREVLHLPVKQVPRNIEVRAFVGIPRGIHGHICQAKIGGEEQNQRNCQWFKPA
jgi:hypothetical protein